MRRTEIMIRVAAVIAAILASIILPIAIVIGSFVYTFALKPPGWKSNENRKFVCGQVKDGKLWYLVHESVPWQIDRMHLATLDVETGEETRIGVSFVRDPQFTTWRLTWINDDLYRTATYRNSNQSPGGSVQISKLENNQFVDLKSSTLEGIVVHTPFVYEGRPSLICRTKAGIYHLLEWDGNDWRISHRMRLPEPIQENQRGQFSVDKTHPFSVFRCYGTDVVCVQTALSDAVIKFVDVIDKKDNDADPLLIRMDIRKRPRYQELSDFFVSDGKSIFRSEAGSLNQVYRSNLDSRWMLVPLPFNSSEMPFAWTRQFVVTDAQQGNAYVIVQCNHRGITIARIADNQVLPPHLKLPDQIHRYLTYYWRLIAFLGIAWLSHCAVLLVAASWFVRTTRMATEDLDLHRWNYAPLYLRSFAAIVDCLCILLTVRLIWYCFLLATYSNMNWTPISELAGRMIDQELYIQTMVNDSSITVADKFSFIRRIFFESFGDDCWKLGLVVACLNIMFLVLGVLKLFVESCFGSRTIGQRFVGIAAVQTTIRPMTRPQLFLRSFIAICFDVPLCITPIPAFLSIAFSKHRQCIGDRLAGVVVVRVDSSNLSKHVS